jgi:hypothetical protein
MSSMPQVLAQTCKHGASCRGCCNALTFCMYALNSVATHLGTISQPTPLRAIIVPFIEPKFQVECKVPLRHTNTSEPPFARDSLQVSCSTPQSENALLLMQEWASAAMLDWHPWSCALRCQDWPCSS